MNASGRDGAVMMPMEIDLTGSIAHKFVFAEIFVGVGGLSAAMEEIGGDCIQVLTTAGCRLANIDMTCDTDFERI